MAVENDPDPDISEVSVNNVVPRIVSGREPDGLESEGNPMEKDVEGVSVKPEADELPADELDDFPAEEVES